MARGDAERLAPADWLIAAAACSTSTMVTAPCGPVPVTEFMSTPCDAASRRAAGETHVRLRGPVGRAARVFSGRGGVAGGAGSSGARIVAKGVPTLTVSPIGTSSSCTTPSCQHSISTAALVVSTTATTCPRVTMSPGFTSHSLSVPSSMSAPRAGMTNSNIRSSRPPIAPRRRSCQAAAARLVPGVWRTGSAPRRCTLARSVHRVRRTPPRRCVR